MTPEQEAMLSFVYHAVLGVELGIVGGLALLLIMGIASVVRGRISKRRARRKREREVRIPRHTDRF